MQINYVYCVIFLFVNATDTSYLCHEDERRELLADIQRGTKLESADARARGNNLLEVTSDICRNFSIQIKVYNIWYKITLFIFNRCSIIFVFQHVFEKLNIYSLDMTTFLWLPEFCCINLSYY